jgi:peroxidase
MHTIWVREHNRIARILSKINPQWEDETLFQETRRIIVASLQHITYNEWLPKVLGFTVMHKFDLFSSKDEYFTAYDEKRDPRTANEWATAAQRFGHSAIRSHYSRVDSKFRPCGSMNLKSSYFRPHPIYE